MLYGKREPGTGSGAIRQEVYQGLGQKKIPRPPSAKGKKNRGRERGRGDRVGATKGNERKMSQNAKRERLGGRRQDEIRKNRGPIVKKRFLTKECLGELSAGVGGGVKKTGKKKSIQLN